MHMKAGSYRLICALSAVALLTGPVPNVLATAKSARTSAGPARLSAAEILAKNEAARGGLQAWRNVQTMMWFGHIESTHATVPGMLFMLAQKRPNKTRFEINAMGDKTVRVFDGTQGWRLHPAHGGPEVQPYSIDEVRFAQGAPGLDGPLIDSAAKGSSVTLEGVDEVEKHRAYHLRVQTGAGETQHVWVDAQTFLEIRYDRTVGGRGGPGRTVSVMYRNYKATDGLQVPTIIETGVGSGGTPDRMVIERVAVNPPIDDRIFKEPGSTQQARSQSQFPLHRSMRQNHTFPLPAPDAVGPNAGASTPQAPEAAPPHP